jgi:membrane protease YdiL (CAAX protease family)
MDPQTASLPASDLAQPPSRSGSGLRPIFVGPNGIRAGWRLLIFLAIYAALVTIQGLIAPRLGQQPTPGVIMAGPAGWGEGLGFVFVMIAAAVMARIERRKISDYGLPLRLALRKNFWLGALLGFLSISGALLAISALHGFRITGLAIYGTTILTATLAWTGACVAIGLCEESVFRGYPLFTLTTGIGFWPAAILMSALFGLAHLFNPGETPTGVLMVVLIALLMCFFVRRSGNLWLAVGFHAGFDWGETFFYGVHDSGFAPYHNLFNSQFSGPTWLTGGGAGPEASVFTLIALVIVGILFSLRYREVRYRPEAVSKQLGNHTSTAVATT